MNWLSRFLGNRSASPNPKTAALPTTHDELVRWLEERFEGNGESLAALSQPAWQLSVATKRPGNRRSKLGGLPSLPPGFQWPRWQDRPLSFLAQIDLLELSPMNASELPNQGMLSIFQSLEFVNWGYDPSQAGSTQVFYFAPEALTPTKPPSDMAIGDSACSHVKGVLPEFSLQATIVTTLHPFENPEVKAVDLSEEQMDVYAELPEDAGVMGAAPRHQLVGCPLQFNGDIREECALVSQGIGNPWRIDRSDPKTADLLSKKGAWRMLFQCDSDERVGVVWGDSGLLSIWIREEDLEARRFDRVWGHVESS